MNNYQRKSTAKYLYDISKGIAIVVVVGNILQGNLNVINLVVGFLSVIILFIFAYKLEGGLKND